MSLDYGCIRILDSRRFLTKSLDDISKNLKDVDYVSLKEEFKVNWQIFTKNLFMLMIVLTFDITVLVILKSSKKKIISDYFSKLNQSIPDAIETEKTNQKSDNLNIKDGKDLTQIYYKSDFVTLADILDKFVQRALKDFKINPLYLMSAPGFTWSAGLKFTYVEIERI